VTWTVIEGEGEFGDQTDTSIVFIPTATGKVVIDAREEEVEGQVTLHVDNMSLTARTMKHSDIKVFPNPVNEMLYFQMENAGIEKIRIRVFNILGEQLLEQDFGHNSMDKSKFELNTSGLNQGVYVYVICFNDKASYGQFVKCMN
ncbi:MAG: T9SS type A sorting domain-containing protein, partial [Bacteroidales bacterium]|nr:T9SS type A sorting domain-containing protein [Bacteroidales bacterium]